VVVRRGLSDLVTRGGCGLFEGARPAPYRFGGRTDPFRL